MQRAHIDRCCIVINSGPFAEYSWPTMLQVKSLKLDKGRKKNPVMEDCECCGCSTPLPHQPPSLPLLHFKSTTRQKKNKKEASFQYVDLREVTHAQCRKMHIYEVRVRMRMFYIWEALTWRGRHRERENHRDHSGAKHFHKHKTTCSFFFMVFDAFTFSIQVERSCCGWLADLSSACHWLVYFK